MSSTQVQGSDVTEQRRGDTRQAYARSAASNLEAQEIQTQERLAQLVGKKCIIRCNIHIYAVEALLDTGAQVSILDRHWVKTYLSDQKIRPLAELTGQTSLQVVGINGEALPYDGWVGVMVSLPGNSDPDLAIQVPFLVSSVSMERPLIGFNVIEQLILGPKEGDDILPAIASLLGGALNMQEGKVTALVNFVQTQPSGDGDQRCSVVKVGPGNIVIPPG